MKETLKNLKKTYQYGKDKKKHLIIFYILSVFFIFSNIVIPVIIAKQLIYLTDNLLEEMIWVSVLLFSVSFVSDTIRLFINKQSFIFVRETIKNIQISASKELLKIELTDIDKNSSGMFIQRINNDAEDMGFVFRIGFNSLIRILTDIGTFVVLFILNKMVFVFFLIMSLILVLINLIKYKKANEKDEIKRVKKEKSSGLIGELVRGIRDIKMLNAKESFVSEIEKNIDDLAQSRFDLDKVIYKYGYYIDLVYDMALLLLVFLIAFLISNSVITVGIAIVLFSYRNRVLGSLMFNIGDLLKNIKSFNLSSKRVFSILESNDFKKETFGNKYIESVSGNLEFQNVNFQYEENKVLNNLNFKINENETVAFVGKSGSGKSTIFSLLCKLYKIESGEVLIDGINIEELDESSIRDNITIISQNPYIFNLSIRENLKLVKENLKEEEMIKACKLACLDEFINTLPDKYDTVVGEAGITLSGGQRQRLAIARAFVQETKIILFDEATSALDNETQSLIQKAIENMKEDYTIIIIAHRLSTVVNSDRILLLEDGKVVDQGSHEYLLKNNKTYKKLYETEIN